MIDSNFFSFNLFIISNIDSFKKFGNNEIHDHFLFSFSYVEHTYAKKEKEKISQISTKTNFAVFFVAEFNNFLAEFFVRNKMEEDGIIQKHYSKYFPFRVRTLLVRIDLKLWKACISNYPQTIITISDDRVAWQFTRPLAAALCTQSATQFPMLPVNISGLT